MCVCVCVYTERPSLLAKRNKLISACRAAGARGVWYMELIWQQFLLLHFGKKKKKEWQLSEGWSMWLLRLNRRIFFARKFTFSFWSSVVTSALQKLMQKGTHIAIGLLEAEVWRKGKCF